MYAEMTLGNNSFDIVGTYLRDLKKIKRISDEEERDLLLDYKLNNNLESAKKVILNNLRFVWFYARKFEGYNIPTVDLVQEGVVGLMKALKTFDISSEVKFISYAVHRVKECIYNYIIDNYSLIKIGTTKEVRKLFFNLRKLRPDTSSLSNLEAKNIASKLDVSVNSVFEVEQRLLGEISLDIDPEEGFSETYLEQEFSDIGYSHEHRVDPSILVEKGDSNKQITLLYQAISTLDERSKDIVYNRYLAEDKLTLSDLSVKYSISIERVRQLEVKALKLLHSKMI